MISVAIRSVGCVALGAAMLLVGLGASPAFAHLSPHEHGSFFAGFTHPLFGLDHILAMVAVGLWATMLGGRAVWIVPTAFVAMMTIGFGLATGGVALPFVEPAILASVIVLGLVIAASLRLPAAAGALLVGAFALFHGHAHGAELGAANAAPYLVGFMLATALLHAAGIGMGFALGARVEEGRAFARIAVRSLGGAIALAGVGLLVGVG